MQAVIVPWGETTPVFPAVGVNEVGWFRTLVPDALVAAAGHKLMRVGAFVEFAVGIEGVLTIGRYEIEKKRELGGTEIRSWEVENAAV